MLSCRVMPDVFEYQRGDGPILISFPHDGTDFPAHIRTELNESGLKSTDCDWYIFELYNRVLEPGISFIRARYSRYLVDLNRSPAGELLYPGKMETGVCPLTTFEGIPIHLPGKQPDGREIKTRIDNYWQPYHNHLQAELTRIKDRHGYAVLWDAHSIRGRMPLLFDGVLPDLNFGTDEGRSCGKEIIEPIMEYACNISDYSVTLNGRFKGGYITRHYGDPGNCIHAIQLEINQNNYLEDTEDPKIDYKKTQKLSRLLQSLLINLFPSSPRSLSLR